MSFSSLQQEKGGQTKNQGIWGAYQRTEFAGQKCIPKSEETGKSRESKDPFTYSRNYQRNKRVEKLNSNFEKLARG